MSMVKRSISKEYRIQVPEGLDLGNTEFLELYRYMTLNRRLEERLGHLYRQNQAVCTRVLAKRPHRSVPPTLSKTVIFWRR